MPRKKADELSAIRKLLDPHATIDVDVGEVMAKVDELLEELQRAHAENQRLRDRMTLREGEIMGQCAALKRKQDSWD